MFYLPFRRLIVLVACVLLVSLSLSLILFPKTALAKSHSPHSIPIPFGEVVQGTFYSNPNDSGSVDFTGATAGIFSQNFPPAIAFNPSPDQQNCTSSTGIDVNTRPFTDVSPNADGSCTTTIAQGAGQQAGVGNLSSFEAKLVAVINLPSAGVLTTNITADDGWIFCMVNNNFSGPQPTPAPGNIMTNPIDSHHCPGLGLPEMADNNSAVFGPTPSTIAINIPAAGSYGIEIDYTECCQGQLSLVVSPFFTLTQPNDIWAGYASSGLPDQPIEYSNVQAYWTVSRAQDCSLGYTPQSATWVGLSGDNSSNQKGSNNLAQIGTQSNCNGGQIFPEVYYAVWQMLPGITPAQKIDEACSDSDYNNCTRVGAIVNANDQIFARVSYQGSGNFILYIHDFTQGWHTGGDGTTLLPQSQPGSDQLAARIRAEWIVEDPPPNKLTNFGTVNFSNCQADGNPINNRPSIIKFVNNKTVTSDLSDNGTTFSVTWINSGS